jgi:hypothetical protein
MALINQQSMQAPPNYLCPVAKTRPRAQFSAWHPANRLKFRTDRRPVEQIRSGDRRGQAAWARPRAIEAIIWRLDNGANWRSIPAELGNTAIAFGSVQRGHFRSGGALCSSAPDGAVTLDSLICPSVPTKQFHPLVSELHLTAG